MTLPFLLPRYEYSGNSDEEVRASTPAQLETGDQSIDAVLRDGFQLQANMAIEDRVRTTVDALIAIADHVAALPGRKNLLWISGSFPFSVEYENLQSIARIISSPAEEANLSSEQLLFVEDIERAAQALNDANIAVYPVDARGLLTMNLGIDKGQQKGSSYGAWQQNDTDLNGRNQRPGKGGLRSPASRGDNNGSSSGAKGPADPILNPDNTTFETMTALADGTGGEAFYKTNDISSSLRRAIDDSRVSYDFGYYPASVKWDGRYRHITVRIKRPDVIVRARKGYFALAEPVASPNALRATIMNAMASPLEATRLGVAVRVNLASTGNRTTLNTIVSFDPRAIQFEAKQGYLTANVNAVFVQLNNKGQVLNAIQRSFPFNFSSDQYKQFGEQQAEFTQSIDVVPNASQLRIVILDGISGNVGAVAIPLARYLLLSPSLR